MVTGILPEQAVSMAPTAPQITILDRGEPPKCPYDNRRLDARHPDGLNARTCPTCVAHSSWVSACRRERARIRAGRPAPERHPGRTSIWYNPQLRTPVPKCRLYHPTAAARRACQRCQARTRYTNALRHDAIREGNYDGMVDASTVVQYITEVLVPSGLSQTKIADVSGVARGMISAAVQGYTKKMLPINASAILSVKPLPYRDRGRGAMVNATGVRRMMRGLYAQGWTASYMAEIVGMTRSGLWRWISATSSSRPYEFVQPEVVETAKGLVDKLGAFDIAELDEPMDGMSSRSAARAAKRGWNVLADWDGLDIDDPRVTPHTYEPLTASEGLVLIDDSKVRRALRFEPVEQDGALKAHRFTDELTEAEYHEIVRVGSRPDHTGDDRFSANLLGQRLNVSERTVQRCRATLARADRILDAAPPLAAVVLAVDLVLETGEWPVGFRLRTALDMLADYPLNLGFRGFYRHLVILAATQPDPYGRGWSDARLAYWLGCTEEDAAALRADAAHAGRRYHTTGRA